MSNPAEHEQWPLMLLDDGPSDESGSWGFPPAPTAASSCSMQELLVEAQIPPELHHEFLHFTPAEFALVAVDLEDLNKFIDELVFPPDMSQTLLVARVRLLWRKCQKLDLPCSSETKPELPVKSTDAVLNGWSQVFPRKLTPQEVREMKQRFSQRYPSEPLSPENMPGPRLLSLVFKQVNEKCWKFIPWKIRLSEDQHDSRMAERPHKMPRLDLLAVDDVPQRDLSLQHMSRAVMQEILDLHATAIALVGGAHFHTLREMNRRFLAKAFERYGSDTGLRCPNHAEAMQADQKLWQSISSLINDEGWCMENAIHEVVVVRNEIATLLMPRPNPPKLPASWVLRKGGLKGLGKGKGKGAKGGKSAKGSGVQVNGLQIATFYKKGQEKHLLCNDFSKGKCTRPNCKFEHKCGVWLPDGSICLQDHTPSQHKKTAH